MHKLYNHCCLAIILICLFLSTSDFGGAIMLLSADSTSIF